MDTEKLLHDIILNTGLQYTLLQPAKKWNISASSNCLQSATVPAFDMLVPNYTLCRAVNLWYAHTLRGKAHLLVNAPR